MDTVLPIWYCRTAVQERLRRRHLRMWPCVWHVDTVTRRLWSSLEVWYTDRVPRPWNTMTSLVNAGLVRNQPDFNQRGRRNALCLGLNWVGPTSQSKLIVCCWRWEFVRPLLLSLSSAFHSLLHYWSSPMGHYSTPIWWHFSTTYDRAINLTSY